MLEFFTALEEADARARLGRAGAASAARVAIALVAVADRRRRREHRGARRSCSASHSGSSSISRAGRCASAPRSRRSSLRVVGGDRQRRRGARARPVVLRHLPRRSKVGPFHEIVDGTTVHGVERYGARQARAALLLRRRAARSASSSARAARPSQFESHRDRRPRRGRPAPATRAPATKWTFYEIDPTVARIARDPRLFTYLRDCDGDFDVEIGDGRQSLGDAPPGEFGLIALDAFTSDAVPVHLITREAIELYLSAAAARRRCCCSTSRTATSSSSRCSATSPTISACTCRTDEIKVTARAGASSAGTRRSGSSWHAHAGDPRTGSAGRPCGREPDARTWTDDYSNVLGALRWE